MNGHILIVDDDQGVRDGLRRLLAGEGYAVQLAEDGASGLRLLEAPGLDLVLLDLDMPGINGLEVCTAFKGLPHGPDTPVLFLTGSHDNAAYEKAIEAGADDFLSKPARWPELRMRVHALVRLGRSIRAQKAGAHALAVQNLQLDEDARLKARMRALLIQDLMIPLTQIRQEAETRLEFEVGRAGWEAVFDRAEHLVRVVAGWRDFLNASETSTPLKCTRVDLKSYLPILIARHQTWADVRKITYSIQIGDQVFPVWADRALFDRIMTHLIDLLLRVVPNGSTINLEAGALSDGRMQLIMQALTGGLPIQGHGTSKEGELSMEWAFAKTAMTSMGGEILEGRHIGYTLKIPQAPPIADPLRE